MNLKSSGLSHHTRAQKEEGVEVRMAGRKGSGLDALKQLVIIYFAILTLRI